MGEMGSYILDCRSTACRTGLACGMDVALWIGGDRACTKLSCEAADRRIPRGEPVLHLIRYKSAAVSLKSSA
jgi:hypothetical protein